GGSDAADIDFLFGRIGAGGNIWYEDLNVDGAVTTADVDTLVRTIFLTEYGDVTLDRAVDLADFSILAAHFNLPSGWAGGNFNGDGLVDLADFAVLASNFNFVSTAEFHLPPGALVNRGVVPEPALGAIVAVAALAWRSRSLWRPAA
ncbi:MAG: hypothetical protein NZ561_00165, partial [Phycisphaerae bacterium]|nr:hypothetical protein [Phycisphaerae bacterium]